MHRRHRGHRDRPRHRLCRGGLAPLRRLPGRLPGLYFIDLGPDGERSFSYWRGEAAARDCFEEPGSRQVLEALGDFDAVYLSGISLGILREDGRRRLLRRLAELRDRGTSIFFDFNFRPRLWAADEREAPEAARPWYEQMLSLCRVALLTAEEAPAAGCPFACQNLCERLAGFGPEEIIVKNGSKDCLAWHKGVLSTVRAQSGARVVDTTAAGDSFSAAYLLGRHLGLDVPEAVRRAHELAAVVIAHRGAVIPGEAMPRMFPVPGSLCAVACE